MVDSREKKGEEGEVRCVSKFWEGEEMGTLWVRPVSLHWSLDGAVHPGQLSC